MHEKSQNGRRHRLKNKIVKCCSTITKKKPLSFTWRIISSSELADEKHGLLIYLGYNLR